MRVTAEKNCYCCNCRKWFHYLGIARHRAMHRDKREDCMITMTSGIKYLYDYSADSGKRRLAEE